MVRADAPKPIRLETLCVRLLRRCNLACRHCWAGSSPFRTDALSWSEVRGFLRSLAMENLRHVSLSGGEPLLFSDLGEAIHDCLDMGLCITLTTNGFVGARYGLVADELEIPSGRRLRVRVSLDGAEAVHDEIRGNGSYRRALAAISQIKHRHGWVGVNTVLVPSVRSSLLDVCAAVRDAGVDDWALIAPLAKGTYRGVVIDTEAVRTAAASLREAAGKIGFTGRIRYWDFRVRERGHLVLESDGRLLMPGYTEETDCSLGDFRQVNLAQLHEAICADAAQEDCEFYTWGGWSLESAS
jgi:MoaA/NifB/PqqE/SkfB family radical SAM enzyme